MLLSLVYPSLFFLPRCRDKMNVLTIPLNLPLKREILPFGARIFYLDITTFCLSFAVLLPRCRDKMNVQTIPLNLPLKRKTLPFGARIFYLDITTFCLSFAVLFTPLCRDKMNVQTIPLNLPLKRETLPFGARIFYLDITTFCLSFAVLLPRCRNKMNVLTIPLNLPLKRETCLRDYYFSPNTPLSGEDSTFLPKQADNLLIKKFLINLPRVQTTQGRLKKPSGDDPTAIKRPDCPARIKPYLNPTWKSICKERPRSGTGMRSSRQPRRYVSRSVCRHRDPPSSRCGSARAHYLPDNAASWRQT